MDTNRTPSISRTNSGLKSGESGQVIISLLLLLALVLVAMVGFAVDATNLWFHRQAVQSAADASCQAGAMDMSAMAAGMTLPNMGFVPGAGGNCSASPSATMCKYAVFNGYNGSGLNPGSPSDSVEWSFPGSVGGTTPPPPSEAANPFLNVTISENVQTHFMPILQGTNYQKVGASCTCGLVQEKEAAPMIVLSPTASGAFTYNGGGRLTIVGGPRRSLQVNSSSTNAIDWNYSGMIDTTRGGPTQTGSDVAVVGGPSQAPASGFSGGSTGNWRSNTLPIGDPYAAVGPPLSVKSAPPPHGTAGTWVKYQQDGCPDHSGSSGNPNHACIEFEPGYYPNGITTNGYSTYTLLPGVYYLGNSFKAGGSATVRIATPCIPTCSPLSTSPWQQTDGVMLYFYNGSLDISGCSGCASGSIDNVASTALTCDGSSPPANLGMPSTLSGNILVGQCAVDATYWDPGGDTTDARGSPGSRGLLVYQDHADTTRPQFTGSGSLVFSGALYFHSTDYADVLSLSGGASSGTFILGQIVSDQVSLTGSGAVNLALNPTPSVYLLKVAMLQ